MMTSFGFCRAAKKKMDSGMLNMMNMLPHSVYCVMAGSICLLGK
jgi:hypothetical protein